MHTLVFVYLWQVILSSQYINVIAHRRFSFYHAGCHPYTLACFISHLVNWLFARMAECTMQ